ncbi:hypothetical protein ILYODFUR_019527 [Ilyodon furcidens]|uniref:Uncharacterized protein n=1 Tax=Ilyodon furcidens TaxID=33524 RepID=A0ABV0V4D8_9TELE
MMPSPPCFIMEECLFRKILSRPYYDPATSDCCEQAREKPAQSYQPVQISSPVLTHLDLPDAPKQTCKAATPKCSWLPPWNHMEISQADGDALKVGHYLQPTIERS